MARIESVIVDDDKPILTIKVNDRPFPKTRGKCDQVASFSMEQTEADIDGKPVMFSGTFFLSKKPRKE